MVFVVVITQSHQFMNMKEKHYFNKIIGATVLTAQTQVQLRFAIASKLWKLKQGNRCSVNSGAKRDKMEIIVEILLFCDGQKAKTNIMYNANLNYSQLKHHLSYLTSSGLLSQDDGRYVTTAKGYRFLELFAELHHILSEDNF